MTDKNNEEIVYSKITGKRRPPSTCTEINKPNLDLMAKAIINLYYSTKGQQLRDRKE
ncbi:hypothetical protein FB550_102393 [Neobacillus bataviensis]|uniref:Uncharacterized protein n=1 Tax=Neobacillus bataviensis TaxID=220685 RepID=A0A561DSN5_9BACI|nr:hypothetical protein [Neobacillus bataviensis]TWE06371.1 hypothetical protein FB550_102393 [Neobacillus bataviensis]